eukprot:TRINITY_DN27952_c0_g2_i1.p1 TRINITY_DN27952_c0_g2~~TRINITY_DN27952_c0_g2_i1.p1  ORF type:complete len:474 (+),score=39.50 TRINITY_DN27952_c0_g2_i1:52-1473(+)
MRVSYVASIGATALAVGNTVNVLTLDQCDSIAQEKCNLTDYVLPFPCSEYDTHELLVQNFHVLCAGNDEAAMKHSMNRSNCVEAVRRKLPIRGPFVPQRVPIPGDHALGKTWWMAPGWRLSSGWVRRWNDLLRSFPNLLKGIPVSTDPKNASFLLSSTGKLSKAIWTKRLREYEMDNGCTPGQLTPRTIHIADERECLSLRSSEMRARMWFVKDAAKDWGEGITVRSTEAIIPEHMCGNTSSPMLLSEYITPVWLIDERKWDSRHFILIASIKPLVVFWRTGYMQMSMRPFDIDSSDMDVHVTNPHLATKYTTDWSQFLKPFEETLLQDLQRVQSNGSAARRVGMIKSRIANLALAWLFSFRNLLRCVGSHEDDTCFQFIGFDVTMTREGIPFLLDVNLYPAFRYAPSNIYEQNVASIAEMSHIVSTLRIASSGRRKIDWPRFRHWQLIFDEEDDKFYERSENSLLLREGQCV